jgi:hypothetical protein
MDMNALPCLARALRACDRSIAATALAISICSMPSLALGAPAPEKLATGYTDVFACKLREGRSMDGVWAAMDRIAALNVPSTAPPDPGFGIFLWTPFRTGSSDDYIWGVNSSNLNQMAQGLSDYIATPQSEAIGASLDASSTCTSGIVSFRELKVASIGNKADRVPDALVEIYACDLKPGATMEKFDKVAELWQSEIVKIASPALQAYGARLWKPFRGASGGHALYWVGAYPDLKSWGHGATDYFASKEGQAVDARINELTTCEADLWVGYWVVAPVQAQ